MRTIRIVIMDAAGTVLDSVRTTVPEDTHCIACRCEDNTGKVLDDSIELITGPNTAKEPAGRW